MLYLCCICVVLCCICVVSIRYEKGLPLHWLWDGDHKDDQHPSFNEDAQALVAVDPIRPVPSRPPVQPSGR